MAALLAAVGVAAFVIRDDRRGNSVDARIAAQYHRHHHTVVMSCPSYVTPACDGAYIELAEGGAVLWEESFRINSGQSVPFTFTGLTQSRSQALDLAKPTLRCKYGKALDTPIPAGVTFLPNEKVQIDMFAGATVTGGPISPQTFTADAGYSFIFSCF